MGFLAKQLPLMPLGAAEAHPGARPEAPRGLRLVSLSEVLTALSYALDLTGGLAPGHTVRTCMIGMRIAHTLGLSDEECAALYDAVLLKDAGSSSNSAYVKAIFDGDDRPTRMNLVRSRSDRGSKVALRLGFPRAMAHAIRSLDEQWDGCGLPDGKRGTEIPLLSRIANLAQTIEAFRSQQGLRRAAWLHDIGKLGISSCLLDKTGSLTKVERKEMKRHPLHTWEVLSWVGAFADFARMAALHHEKLDGSGYPWGVNADELDTATRILCVADVFEALTSARPYRAGLPPSVAMSIIQRDAGVRLCPLAVEGLSSLVETLPNQMVG